MNSAERDPWRLPYIDRKAPSARRAGRPSDLRVTPAHIETHNRPIALDWARRGLHRRAGALLLVPTADGTSGRTFGLGTTLAKLSRGRLARHFCRDWHVETAHSRQIARAGMVGSYRYVRIARRPKRAEAVDPQDATRPHQPACRYISARDLIKTADQRHGGASSNVCSDRLPNTTRRTSVIARRLLKAISRWFMPWSGERRGARLSCGVGEDGHRRVTLVCKGLQSTPAWSSSLLPRCSDERDMGAQPMCSAGVMIMTPG